jgi:hypothetical protein
LLAERTYPDVARGSISGHDERRRQKANGGFSGGVVLTGELRCRNDALRCGGCRHSKPRDDCRRSEPCGINCCGGGIVPGVGKTLGKPESMKVRIYILKTIFIAFLSTFRTALSPQIILKFMDQLPKPIKFHLQPRLGGTQTGCLCAINKTIEKVLSIETSILI